MDATTWIHVENTLSKRNQTQYILHNFIYIKCTEI